MHHGYEPVTYVLIPEIYTVTEKREKGLKHKIQKSHILFQERVLF